MSASSGNPRLNAYGYVRVHMHVCVWACMCVGVCSCVWVCVHMCMCMHMYACGRAHVYLTRKKTLLIHSLISFVATLRPPPSLVPCSLGDVHGLIQSILETICFVLLYIKGPFYFAYHRSKVISCFLLPLLKRLDQESVGYKIWIWTPLQKLHRCTSGTS